MTDQQLYVAIGVPVFAIFMAMLTNIIVIIWQARGLEKRLDRIESRLTGIEQDYKVFFQDIARVKAKVGIGG
jgi:hypothetical protein